MSLEFLRRFRGEKNNPQQEIILGTSFEPFKDAQKFCKPGEQYKPFLVPESYKYVLALRRPVSLYGMKGCVDVISEDPKAGYEALLARFPMTQPLGLAYFEIIYRGKDDQRIKEQPYILRFAFHPSTQLAYAKLLNSYAEVKCGEKRYILLWNLNHDAIKWNMQRLDEDKNILVVEKDLFEIDQINAKEVDVEEEERKRDIEREGYVWLPKDIQKLSTIELTFRNFDHGSDQELPSEPDEPTRKQLPVVA